MFRDALDVDVSFLLVADVARRVRRQPGHHHLHDWNTISAAEAVPVAEQKSGWCQSCCSHFAVVVVAAESIPGDHCRLQYETQSVDSLPIHPQNQRQRRLDCHCRTVRNRHCRTQVGVLEMNSGIALESLDLLPIHPQNQRQRRLDCHCRTVRNRHFRTQVDVLEMNSGIALEYASGSLLVGAVAVVVASGRSGGFHLQRCRREMYLQHRVDDAMSCERYSLLRKVRMLLPLDIARRAGNSMVTLVVVVVRFRRRQSRRPAPPVAVIHRGVSLPTSADTAARGHHPLGQPEHFLVAAVVEVVFAAAVAPALALA